MNFDGAAFSDDAIPEGEVTAVAENFVSGEAGIATGTLSAGGALELNPELARRGGAVPLRAGAARLGAARGGLGRSGARPVRYRFLRRVSFGRVRVNAKAYLFVFVAPLAGPEVVLGPVRIAGIHHTRRVLVPASAEYSRIVDVFENPNGIPMEVTVSFESYLSVPESYTEVSGSWVAGENGDGTAVAWVYAGAGGTPLVPNRTGLDELRMTEEWRRVTIPAGGTAILVHFAVQAPDLATALARASSLSTAPPISDLPEVLNFEP